LISCFGETVNKPLLTLLQTKRIFNFALFFMAGYSLTAFSFSGSMFIPSGDRISQGTVLLLQEFTLLRIEFMGASLNR
jgi:hypothetical protein